jgi:hypothetical protein
MSESMMGLLIGLVSVLFAVGVVGAGLAGAYFIGKERGRRAALEQPAQSGSAAELIARTERALEAMSLEVERIGESQRYAARMLAEAAGKPKPDPVSLRSTTPRTPT